MNYGMKLRVKNAIATIFIASISGCVEDVRPITVVASPSGETVAVVERSSGYGAFDSYTYDVYLQPFAKKKVYVAVFQAPRNALNQEGVDLIWQSEDRLLIRYSSAALARMTTDVVSVPPNRIIHVTLEGPPAALQ